MNTICVFNFLWWIFCIIRLLPTALKNLREKLGGKNAIVAYIIGEIGECLRLEGKNDQASAVLKQALHLRKQTLGSNSFSVASIMISQALILIDSAKPEEAKDLLEKEVVPMLTSTHIGLNHPLTMYAKGCVGLSLNVIAGMTGKNDNDDDNVSLNSKSSSSSQSMIARRRIGANSDQTVSSSLRFGKDREGVRLIEEALIYFDTYPRCPFGDSHPWILELGGWDQLSERTSQNSRHSNNNRGKVDNNENDNGSKGGGLRRKKSEFGVNNVGGGPGQT